MSKYTLVCGFLASSRGSRLMGIFLSGITLGQTLRYRQRMVFEGLASFIVYRSRSIGMLLIPYSISVWSVGSANPTLLLLLTTGARGD